MQTLARSALASGMDWQNLDAKSWGLDEMLNRSVAALNIVPDILKQAERTAQRDQDGQTVRGRKLTTVGKLEEPVGGFRMRSVISQARRH